MDFKLSSIEGINRSKRQLEGNKIHEVEFKGVTISSGTSNSGNAWQAMDIRFENEDGYFNHRAFALGEKDFERPIFKDKNTGVERPAPSRAENLALLLAHVGQTLSPANFAKFSNMKWDLPKDFIPMAETFAKAMKAAEGKITKLKLITKADNTPSLPYFVRLNKEGATFLSTNFLGDNVNFTPYEAERIAKAAENTKPTEMEKIVPSVPSAKDFDNVDFDLNLDI